MGSRAGDHLLNVNGLGISLDRRESGASINFISHAHTDHIAAARSGNILASDETSALLGAYRIKPKKLEDEKGWIKLLDAGHMLGSKQLFVSDYDGGIDYVYTGDFQMQKSAIAKQIQTRKADVVIIDSTYPRPEFRFDDREEVEEAMGIWIRQKMERGIVLFGSYPMGKSQELISIINGFGITPVVTPRIAEISAMHNSLGAGLDFLSRDMDSERTDEALSGNFVGIVEAGKLREAAAAVSAAHSKRVYTASATGFAKLYRMGTDVQFPLSDHADFWQSVDYLNAVSPSLVLTYGGSQDVFAENLTKVGFKAMPFGEFRQDGLKTIEARWHSAKRL